MRLVTSFYPVDESCLGGGDKGELRTRRNLHRKGLRGGWQVRQKRKCCQLMGKMLEGLGLEGDRSRFHVNPFISPSLHLTSTGRV